MGTTPSKLTENFQNECIDEVTFTINGIAHIVRADGKLITATTTLNTYIRNVAHLTGTKLMCLEGGCGSCVVVAEILDPVTRRKKMISVNSCLVTVLTCQNWVITTIEGIGNKDGYNILQSRLAEYNGSQCGFCSPGFVMTMYSLYGENPELTPYEIETSFSGNICRCTGYRPILNAFRSVCEERDRCPDLEDLVVCPLKDLQNQKSAIKDTSLSISMPLQKWFRVIDMAELLQVLNLFGNVEYMLVAGNTAHGVYRRDPNISVFIDINNIPYLHEFTITNNIVIGACNSLADIITNFYKISKNKPEFEYLEEIANHYCLVANVPVRNIATIGGSLMLKHMYNRFQSDIFLTLETFKAQINIINRDGTMHPPVTPLEFLDLEMNGRVIVNITFFPLLYNHVYRTYKIMPRSQNAAATVNAGFLIQLSQDLSTVLDATIVYGNINTYFTHAFQTEKFLIQKKLYDDNILQGVYQSLNNELDCDTNPPEASPESRKQMAIALFYKFVLSTADPKLLSTQNKSGGTLLERPISSGTEDYQTQPKEYPLTEPIPKLEALAQTSGEAKYIVDLDSTPYFYGAFVLADTLPGSKLKHIDPSLALQVPGVVKVITAKDVPGVNSFIPSTGKLIYNVPEPIFCDGEVAYNGQLVALVIAETDEIANSAVAFVNVEYDPPDTNRQWAYTTREAVDEPDKKRLTPIEEVKRTRQGSDVRKVIRGTHDMTAQYHFYMETQTCICIPIEDGLDVYSSTQWMDSVQKSISECCSIPEAHINLNVRRLGGGYGGKLSRANLTACACAVATTTLNQPIYIRVKMEPNFRCLGKRFPLSADYEVGVDDAGKIQYMNLSYYSNTGLFTNDYITQLLVPEIRNCYDPSTWNINGYNVSTDTPNNTYTRGPGSMEAIGLTEAIMTHIAMELKISDVDVRLQNIMKDSPVAQMLQDFQNKSEINDRLKSVAIFNNSNQWKKRGIGLAVMSFNPSFLGALSVMVVIYSQDGTVAISHGGIEMGQGINTKVAQVAAHVLGISLDLIQIKPSSALISPNNAMTVGSATSENACRATIQCCQKLLDMMEPVKVKLKDPKWIDITRACGDASMDLRAIASFHPDDATEYQVYGITFAEVEVDTLTGQRQILRIDLLEDVGQSMSPFVDVDQIQGAFIMGIGLYLSEELLYNESNGELLNTRTWNYHVPLALDIPIDWRVEFLPNAINKVGVYGSKATGEPAICMSVAVPLAIRRALSATRKVNDSSANAWVPFDGPSTVAETLLYTKPNYRRYTLK